MFKKIKKWGNSLAIRIPKREAEQLDLQEDKEVEVKKEDGKLVLEPKQDKLREVVEQIDEDNLHSIQFPEDGPKGNEIW